MTAISPLLFMAIDPKTAAALLVLARVLVEDGRDLVLIGAIVPQLLIDLRLGLQTSGRTTRDVDAVVRAVSWEDFGRIRRRLFEAGFRPGSPPHELVFEQDVNIDLIPYGPGLVQNDRLEWPGEDRVMSTLGVEEAFECAKQEQIAPGLRLRVVPIPGLVLLKLVAYQDRPEERARDLTDVVYCFEHYEGRIEESRRFDLTGVTVEGQPIQFDEAGAYLLGTEVAGLARPKSLDAVSRFLKILADEYAKPIGQILTQERSFTNNERRRRELFRLFRVFAAGVGTVAEMP